MGFELGLARTGMFIGLYLFMFWGIFGSRVRKTYIHKLSTLSVGILLMGGLITLSSFWRGESFPYLDIKFLMYFTLVNYLLSVIFGGFITALIWDKPRK